MTSTRILTGITTTGIPHLGNYAGAIRPAIESTQSSDTDAFFFLADYHALIKADDPTVVARSRMQIAATWLAAGLDPEKVTFYRQSDIPEIPELTWILNCLSPKGLMNRAHAYKAMVDKNTEQNAETDDGVTMGLFSYPVLMAADILMFNAQKVPVGPDQVQHIEMTRDLAQRFNHHYGKGKEVFVLPEVQLDDNVALLPGLDGRKMSKSYHNTIPLFEGTSKELKTLINQIQTNSLQPGEPKDPDDAVLFTLYRAFASKAQSDELSQSLRDGMAWGDAKTALFNLLDGILEPGRERYHQLVQQPDYLEDILLAGAKKAREISVPFMESIREAVGLQRASSKLLKSSKPAAKAKAKKARLVTFRERDSFRFRLLDGNSQELLCSVEFADPKEAGRIMKQLKQANAISLLDNEKLALMVEGKAVAHAVNVSDEDQWLESFTAALESLQED